MQGSVITISIETKEIIANNQYRNKRTGLGHAQTLLSLSVQTELKKTKLRASQISVMKIRAPKLYNALSGSSSISSGRSKNIQRILVGDRVTQTISLALESCLNPRKS